MRLGTWVNNAAKTNCAKVLILAAVTILIIFLVNIYTTGFIKSISILIGLIAGTAIAASMGLVDFHTCSSSTGRSRSNAFLLLELLSLKSPPSLMMCIIATVSMVESTGVYLALSDITKDPINSTRLRNGYRAEGLAVLLGGLFNTFPYTGFSQKRWSCEVVRYQDSLANLLCRWFPCSSWTPS